MYIIQSICLIISILILIFIIPVLTVVKRCDSIDIRNTPNSAYITVGSKSNMTIYGACTVLDGDIQIVMITNHTTGNLSSNNRDQEFISFPNLVEITGSLLVYDVYGLTSLKHIFPKLRVIGGQSLIMSYALVIFDNPSLLSVSLPKLRLIRNGGVRIQKNPKLCYGDTINWNSILGGTIREVMVENSKSIGDDGSRCNLKPDCKIDEKLQNQCQKWRKSADNDVFACWNKHDCQHYCPYFRNSDGTLGPGCTDNGRLCHDECVGGCEQQNDPTSCFSCKHFELDGVCVKECPSHYYDFMGRRCISKEECNSKKPVKAASKSSENQRLVWKAFNGKCHYDCPKGYEEDERDNTTCKLCAYSCPKKCSGGLIDSISDVMRFKKCNVIEGNLIIRINMGSENSGIEKLVDGFGEIEEVMGYLKIENSHTLTNLFMFKSLKKIHGNVLVNDKYSLVISDNHNLKFLFNVQLPQFELVRGSISMIGNKMLCIQKIDDFLRRLNRNREDESIADSNGDQTICNEVNIDVRVAKIYSFGFNIRWDQFVPSKNETDKFLGYQIFYRQAYGEKVSRETDRYSCSDPWKMDFLNTTEDVTNVGAFIPATANSNYAFYIQTVHHKSVKGNVGISPIMYVNTSYGYPDPPNIEMMKVKSSDSVYIKLSKPDNKNGEVTHYRISWIMNPDTGTHILKQEDPCSYFRHLKLEQTRKMYLSFENEEDEDTETCSAKPGCCECKAKENEILTEVDSNLNTDSDLSTNVMNSIDNSNDTSTITRIKRKSEININKALPYFSVGLNVLPDVTEIDTLDILSANSSTKKILLKNLKHYTEYKLLIEACQDIKAKENYCSKPAMTVIRTQAKPEYDLVDIDTIEYDILKVKNDTTKKLEGRVITWDDPEDPNSIILGYKVKIWKNDGDTPLEQCVRYTDFINMNRTVIFNGLSEGYYSFEIKTLTMYGLSKGIKIEDFFNVYIPGWFTWDRILYILIGVCLIGFLIYYFGKRYYKRNFGKKVEEYIRQTISANPEYLSQLDFYRIDEWELKREDLTIIRELGSGTFGTVSLGWGKNIKSINGVTFGDCAIKMVPDKANHAEKIHFLLEASVMKQFNTSFIVKLLGVVSEGEPVLVVMELMENGNLRDFLRSRRPDAEENINNAPLPAMVDYFKWAIQIADGMAYLESMKFCHRDLAARNCMVSIDETVKIGDFGMARDIYYHEYYRPAGKRLMPVRWMAPESLKDGLFTIKSDVWSYGVVLYEMLTLGEQPYAGLSNDQVFNYIGVKRNVLLRPRSCPDFWYNLMRVCWRYDPRERPCFYQIVLYLRETIEKTTLKEKLEKIFETQSFVISHFEEIEDEYYDFTYNEELEDEKKHNILKELDRMAEENETQYFKKDVIETNYNDEINMYDDNESFLPSKAEYTDIEAGHHARPKIKSKEKGRFDTLTLDDMNNLEMPEILTPKQIEELHKEKEEIKKRKISERRIHEELEAKNEDELEKLNEEIKKEEENKTTEENDHVIVEPTKKTSKSGGSRRLPPDMYSSSKK